MSSFHMFIGILALTPAWITVVHAAVARCGISRSSNQAAALFACAAAALPVAGALWAAHLGFLSGGELLVGVSYAVLVYGLLAYSYFHVFNMGETARRVRMLVELTEHGAIRTEDLRSFYNTEIMLERRIERLISLGQLKADGERLILSSKRLYFAASVMSLWCTVLGLAPLKGLSGGR